MHFQILLLNNQPLDISFQWSCCVGIVSDFRENKFDQFIPRSQWMKNNSVILLWYNRVSNEISLSLKIILWMMLEWGIFYPFTENNNKLVDRLVGFCLNCLLYALSLLSTDADNMCRVDALHKCLPLTFTTKQTDWRGYFH